MPDSIRVVHAPRLTIEEIASLDGASVLEPEALDEAIFAVRHNANGEACAAYQSEQLIDLLIPWLGAEPDEAEAYDTAMDYLCSQVLRALPYMGPRAPKVLAELFDEDLLDPDLEPTAVHEIQGKRYVEL